MSKDILDSSLVGRWLVNSSLLDMSGNGNHGINYGTLPVINERGQGRKWGYTDRITILNNEKFNIGNDDFSMGFWIKSPFLPTSNWGGFFRKGNTISAVSHSFGINQYSNINNRIAFQISNDVGGSYNYVYSFTLNDGWNFFYAVRKGLNIKIYMDGILVRNTNTLTIANLTNTFNFYLGYYYFNKLMLDDARIYNRALSQEEITNIYEATKISKNIFPPIRNFKSECPIYLRETFAGHPVGETYPRGWSLDGASIEIKELTDATRYMQWTSNGIKKIQYNQSTDVDASMYWNGTKIEGKLSDLITANSWLSVSNGYLIFTGVTGNTLANLIIKK